MGTFRIEAVGVESQSGIGAWQILGVGAAGAPSNANLLTILNRAVRQLTTDADSFVLLTAASIRLIPDSAGIFLDGSVVAISEVYLPVGFTVRQAAFVQTTVIKGGDFSSTFNLQVGATVGPTDSTLSSPVSASLAYPVVPPLTLNYLLVTTFRLDWLPTATSDIGACLLKITGSYDTVAFSWEVANGSDYTTPSGQAGKLFTGGALFQISSGDGDIANLYSTATPTKTGVDLDGTLGAGSGDGATSIRFSWNIAGVADSIDVASADFDDWTSVIISFLLPDTLPVDTDIMVEVLSDGFPAIPAPNGTGVQFGGSVKLGTIKIYVVKGSGIYRIVTDKTNDTLYIDSPNSDDTDDFAIPHPHVKTGFIGG